MKSSKIMAAAIGLTLSFGYSNTVIAADTIPSELLDFAAQNNLVFHTAAAPIINKYPLQGKSVNLSGKLSISGSARYKGRTFPFSAPGDKKAIQHITYIFGQPADDGTIPFNLNHPYGDFDGVMTPVKRDQYNLQMNDPQGSMLSSLVLYSQQSGNEWKSTGYSYTAKATQKKVKGIVTTFLEVKEKASFKITIPGLTGAVAKYTYSFDWKAPVQ